jgi:hypothetical protein
MKAALTRKCNFVPFVSRISHMLAIAVAQEADILQLVKRVGTNQSPCAIGVCDICNENKVWPNVNTNVSYNAEIFACWHCMCKECTEEILSCGQPCPFNLVYFGDRRIAHS